MSDHLKFICKLEGTTSGCFHRHSSWGTLDAVLGKVVQTLGDDEVVHTVHLGGLKFHKMELACKKITK